MRITGLLLLAAACLAPRDLDVETLTGSPFDALKLPRPRAEKEPPRYPSQRSPLPLPNELSGILAPASVDAESHLEWKHGTLRKAGSVTDPAPIEWDMTRYPPTVSETLYTYVASRYMMVLLHPAQVSESELCETMIEMGDGCTEAAAACRADLPKLAELVMAAVGKPPKDAPKKPDDETFRAVVAELATMSPYEPGFGRWMLSMRSDPLLSILEKIIEADENAVVTRNAVFLLRCFDDPKVLPLLRSQAKSKDKVIRNRAVAALAARADEESIPWLAEQLAGEDKPFRCMAAWALGRVASPKGLGPLLEAARTGDPEFWWSAIPALARLADGLSIEERAKLLESLVALEKRVSAIANAKAVTEKFAASAPDAANLRRTILAERLRIAEARAGAQDQVQWMRKLGPQTPPSETAKEGPIQRANLDFFNETLERLK